MCADLCLNLVCSANKQSWMNYSDFMPWPKQTLGYIVYPAVGKLLAWVFFLGSHL